MPFPLAHPLAALPFRRWCPRYFNFAALVIGSLVPDLAACIDDWEYFSHTMLGSIGFCLPVGLLSLWTFYHLRAPLAASFPNPHRDALVRLCGKPHQSLVIWVSSLMLGSWIHIGWDLFTHDHSWLAQQMGSFSAELPYVGRCQIRISRGLWLLSTCAGMAVLAAGYLSFLKGTKLPLFAFSPGDGRAYATWMIVLLVPSFGAIPLAMDLMTPDSGFSSFIRWAAMYYFGLLYVTVMIFGIFLKVRPRTRQ